MRELWEATRPFAGWVYLAVLVLPGMIGVVWWYRQVRGDGPVRDLSRHELAYLDGGERAVVLAAVRRLWRTGVLVVTSRGLIHAPEPKRLPDRIDNAVAANADHVLPQTLIRPLQPVVRSTVRRLEDDGLLVHRRDVRRRVGTVLVLQLGVCAVGLALVVVALALREPAGGELLFLACAVLAVVIIVRVNRPGLPVPTRRGRAQLVAAGLRPAPRSGLRRFTALVTAQAVFLRTSVPGRDEDDPGSWAEGWSDATAGWGDSSGGDGGGDSGGGGGGGES